MRASITRHIRHQYECVEFADLEEGWRALLADTAIRVALIDIVMPREEGLALIERIAKSDIARVAATPVVAIASAEGYSGNALDEARGRALEAGAVDFIAKATSGVETLARIGAAMRLAQAREAADALREKASLDMPVDPVSGVMTMEYLHAAREQLLAFARRNQSELAILCFGLDGVPQLEALYGPQITASIARSLAGVIARGLRREETVAQAAEDAIFVLSPGRSLADTAALVAALQTRVASVVMRHRGELIQVTVSAGAASVCADRDATSAQALTELAQRRMLEARAAGAGQFRGASEPPPAVEAEVPAEPPLSVSAAQTGSIDEALASLQRDGPEALRPHLLRLAQRLLPLLRLMEREFQLNFRLTRLKERASRK